MGGRGKKSAPAAGFDGVDYDTKSANDIGDADYAAQSMAQSAGESAEETAALKRYADGADIEINGALRSGAEPTGDAAKMDAVINRNSLSRPATLYRGLRTEGDYNRLANTKVGDVLSDKAYTSTSTSAPVALGFGKRVTFKIDAPKGTKAAVGRSGEKEVILGRNTKLKVTGVKRTIVGGKPAIQIQASVVK